MGKSSSVVIGYRYFFGIHMGIGRGPVDSIAAIKVGDRLAWPLETTQIVGWNWIEGTQEYEMITQTIPAPPPMTGSGQISINAPDLFGGDKSEGGIVGSLDVMMGEPDQGLNSRLADMLGGLVPAFRGVATLFFDGQVCAMNPYPKAWKFRVRRALKGWDGDVWYPQKCKIVMCGDIHAMNPAHMIYEAATNRDWGRGHPRYRLNEESFVSAANTLADECFGLCLAWKRDTDLDAFIQTILDHIGAVLYPDRETGLITLRLIRDDYDIADLPTFGPDSGLLDVSDDDSTTNEVLANEMIVTYHDPVNDVDGQVRAQNIGSMQALNAVNPKTADYPGIPTADLAMRVAQRDLRVNGLQLRRLKITLDRRGWRIVPGLPFVINDPARGINNLVVRAGKYEDEVNGSKITVTAVEDVFGMPDSTPGQVQEPIYTPPDRAPIPADTRLAVEVPFIEMIRQMSQPDLDAFADTSGLTMLMAKRPMGLSPNYSLYTKATGDAKYVSRGNGTWTPTASVGFCNRLQTTISYFDDLDIGTDLMSKFALLGDEIVYISLVDTANKQMIIVRSQADTVPAKHAHGTRLWVYQGRVGTDRREYAVAEVVGMKAATKTSSGELDQSLAPIDNVTIASRHFMPYAPGNVTINGADLDHIEGVAGDLTVAWAHRSRLLQADQVVTHQSGNIGPEAGTSYTIVVKDRTAGTTLRTVTGETGTSWVYTDAMATADGSITKLTIELSSVRGGLNSWQKHSIDVDKFPAGTTGWGLGYDSNFGG